MAGIFSSLFKQHKPRQFGFKPVYYNEEKELRQNRENRIKAEIENDESNGEFRKLLREKWRKNHVALANKRSNVRIIIIAVLLALICYWMLR